MGRLNGKTAVVTGAARGIGRATAVRLAAEGADVVLVDVAHPIDGCPYPLGTESQLALTAQRCRALGSSVLECVADVRSQEQLQDLVGTALDRLGGIDVLINNAGIAAPSGRLVHEMTEDQWDLMVDIDLKGAWRAIREIAPPMMAQRSGSIVNISSTAGMVGYRYFSAYVTAKHGLLGLTRAAALDYAPYGMRVNAVCPGSVRDDPALEGRMLAEIARCLEVPVEDHEATFVESQPTNRLVDAHDVAGAVAWLASDDSRDVTGAIIPVDGGYAAR